MDTQHTAVEVNRPWRVVSEQGGFLSGHDEEEQAKARCERANADAVFLGIPTRYNVVTKALKAPVSSL